MDKKLWFRAKRYGWGWYPVAWQGWGIILMYAFVISTNAVYLNNHEHSGSDFLMQFFPQVFILTVFLIIICYTTGETPRWRWGKEEEMVDVLDEQGQKTGMVVSRAETYVKGYWSAASDVWVINSKNEILLQLRSPQKPNNPNMWDISAAGRVGAGETPLTGARRELEEEIGVVAKPEELQYLGIIRESETRHGGTFIVNIFCSVYVLKRDVNIAELKLQESEVSKVVWIPIAELKQRVLANDPTLCPHPAEYPVLFDYLDSLHVPH